ncbi:hypothetical protein [Planctomycetes bacterium K23_9]|uniref:Nickel uptake substrate-specific transmembrane region n=1 Tax=Stieleria marina TaxID=1930275 RepID=A0A517NNY1_9BACT|nr:hypothetical protein K239x_07770 [Planctomycetes bacterium K23_9]
MIQRFASRILRQARRSCLIFVALVPFVGCLSRLYGQGFSYDGVFELTLLDPEGEPVEGVSVRLKTLRFEEIRSLRIGLFEQAKVSDADGFVRLTYPTTYETRLGLGTTSEIGFVFEHPEFVTQQISFDPTTDATKHTLDRGCRLSFSAVDAEREPIGNFSVYMSGPAALVTWFAEKGTSAKFSTAIPDGSWQAILVSPRNDGRHLFSQVMPVRLAEDQVVSIRKVPMTGGMRLTGRLSENVPRPIRNGTVSVACIPKSSQQRGGNEAAPLGWNEWTVVNDDGTFEFASLPVMETMQIIARCDGWLIDDEQGDRLFFRGKYVSASERTNQGNLALTLPMVPSGNLRVVVKDENGQPVRYAKVYARPMQKLLSGELTYVGSGARTVDKIWKDLDQDFDPELFRWPNLRGFQCATNSDGVAVVSGIPLDRSFRLTATLEGHSIVNAETPGLPQILMRVESVKRAEVELLAKPNAASETPPK